MNQKSTNSPERKLIFGHMDAPAMVYYRDRTEHNGVETWNDGSASFPSLRAALQALVPNDAGIVVNSIVINTLNGNFELRAEDVVKQL
ncbi:hypothetical protein [Shinella sp. JR1-6]|uniref:hypothetical protein n=1 Tax=Shinella sp. JR1-6 TaxID=2527671 RepID=UPI00102D4D83|nr:hypothetical protein [Shinella sp. JR1-6]TAA56036.1 hypothetical protein EXZ48_23210 [Shinella sp. JR1-6]